MVNLSLRTASQEILQLLLRRLGTVSQLARHTHSQVTHRTSKTNRLVLLGSTSSTTASRTTWTPTAQSSVPGRRRKDTQQRVSTECSCRTDVCRWSPTRQTTTPASTPRSSTRGTPSTQPRRYTSTNSFKPITSGPERDNFNFLHFFFLPPPLELTS